MTPPPRFDAVLFDCDGVLVDSEPITNGVLRECLNQSCWAITHAECIVMQIEMAGMAPYFGDRIFNGHDLPRSKPPPDVYLAAAEHLRADLARCLVIEDTATGVRAGLAAGATVWGYGPGGHGRAFEGLPVARVFHHMDELAVALVD